MPNDVFEEYDDNKTQAETDDGFDAFNDSVERGKEVKCSSCGGNMVFDPETQTLKCEYCGSTVAIEKDLSVREFDIRKAFENAKKWDNAIVVRCENCGAKVVIGSDEVAKVCPYCGTSQIKKTDEMAGLKPNAVFPFALTSEDAVTSAKKWARRRIFAPRKFKKNIEAKNFRGVFEPGFTFDSRTVSDYDGVVGYTRTRTVGSGKNRRVETYTEWEHVNGTFSKMFDDYTVSASREMPQSELNKLSPFDQKTISVYDKKFLAGYHANHYTKDITVCWKEAKDGMDALIRQGIINRYGCDTVQYLNVATHHYDVTYKYVLYPVYRFSFGYKSKDYAIAVNGTTGKVNGKTPVSPWRVLVAVLLGLAVAIGVGFLVYNGYISGYLGY